MWCLGVFEYLTFTREEASERILLVLSLLLKLFYCLRCTVNLNFLKGKAAKHYSSVDIKPNRNITVCRLIFNIAASY